MNQELFQRVCNIIIKSNDIEAIDALKKIIDEKLSSIEDKKEFYLFLLSNLSKHLDMVPIDEDTPDKLKLNEEGLKKLQMIEEIISSKPEIKGDYYDILITLANYNVDTINDFIFRLIDDKGVWDFLVDNVISLAINNEVVDNIICFGELDSDILIKIGERVSELNSSIREVYKNDSKQDECRELIRERAQLIFMCHRIIDIYGIDDVNISKEFIKTILDPKYSNTIASIYQMSILKNVLSLDKSKRNIELGELLDQYGERPLIPHIMPVLDELSITDINKIDDIEDMVRIVLLSTTDNIEHKRQFLKNLIESKAVYKLSPDLILNIFEYMSVIESKTIDYIQRESQESCTNLELSLEKYDELKEKILEFLKNSKNDEPKRRYFYELFLSDMLLKKSAFFDDLIIYIMNNFSVNYDYSPTTEYGPEGLSYLICILGSDDVIREFLKLPTTPLYIPGLTDYLDACYLNLKVNNFDKAKEIFDNPNFNVLPIQDQESLNKDGMYTFEVERYDYSDSLTTIVNTIGEKLKDNPGLYEFLKHILCSEKVKYIDLDTLMTISDIDNILNQNSLSTIIKNKYELGLLKFTSPSGDSLDGYDGIRLSTDDEIEEVMSSIQSPNKTKGMKY